MNAVVITAVALAALVIGWGQRTIIFRLAVPAGEPPRRACPRCGHQFPPTRRRPWLVQPPSGRCVACQARTGPPPLSIELITALLLGGLAARLHPGLVLAAAAWLAICAVPLAWIDAAVHRLPDVLTAAAYAGTTALLLLAATSEEWHDLLGWLFPGGRPGQPIGDDRLGMRLHNIGLHPRQARSTALFILATELPAAILARMLGIHIQVAVQWQKAAAGDWMTYAADVSRRIPQREGQK